MTTYPSHTTAVASGASIFLSAMFFQSQYKRWNAASSISSAKATNAAVKLESPISIVVGGTSGIGAAIAVKIAQHSNNPAIRIVGRDAAAAQKVIARMQALNPGGKYEFDRCDLTLLSQTRPLIQKYLTEFPRITHFVLSAGIYTTNPRTETVEGNDIKMMLQYYSRYLLLRELMPSLEAGNAKVLYVLNSKQGKISQLDWSDLDLKNGGFTPETARNHYCSMSDITIQRLADEHPTVSFTHIWPGFVDTNILSGLPSAPLRLILSGVSKLVATPADDCAEVCLATLQCAVTGKASYVGHLGEPIKDKNLASDEEMDKVIKHSDALVDASTA